MPLLRLPQVLRNEYHATDEELAGIDRGLADAADAKEQRFATEAEVRAAFGKFRRA